MATDSKSDSTSDENAGSNIAGTATWGKGDKSPTMGQFTGNPGVKQIPSDSTQVSEVAELFFGDSFFDMLCQLCICVVPEQGMVCCNIACPKIIILCDWSATFKSEKHNIMRPVHQVLSYYITLYVLTPKAIIRQYNLTNIFKLLNCALYMVSYNLNSGKILKVIL
jgi:hypothetical protein